MQTAADIPLRLAKIPWKLSKSSKVISIKNMKIKLLLLLHILRQRGWMLSIPLSITISPLLLALPGQAQTNTSVLSLPTEDTELTIANAMEPVQGDDPATSSGLPVLAGSELTVPTGNGEVIADIQIRYIDQDGNLVEDPSRSQAIAQEFALQPGDAYDPELALAGLTRIATLFAANQQATLTLEPADNPDQVLMAVNVDEPNEFFFTPDLTVSRPTALQGPSHPSTVPALSDNARGISAGVRVGIANLGGSDRTLSLGIEGGENTLGVDLDFREVFEDESGYGINFANQRAVEPEFTGGDTELETPSGDEPWVHRIGGGVEYFRPLATNLEAALGVSYQQISVREDVFSDNIAPTDELGNALTVSDDGEDDLLTINLAGIFDSRDSTRNPTKGSKLLFGVDQSIPIGDADILFTRLSANYTQFLPLNLFGFTEGPRTLVLNLQGGTILGDTPPYDAFSLGGSSSVRGYGSGEVGTGESFVQASAEYRFPILSFNAFDDDVALGGTFFFDYATDLGTGDEVIGRPAEVRDKPGDGFGYGVGLRALTSFGPVRLEFGINDEGGSRVIFNIGDRF